MYESDNYGLPNTNPLAPLSNERRIMHDSTHCPRYPTDHPQFFAAMGWNEDEAVRIYSACEAAIAQEDYGKDWMFEVDSDDDLKWYMAHPEACFDLRHPMFWYYRGYSIREAINKAVIAVSTIGKVQRHQPPDEAVQMLQALAQARSMALPAPTTRDVDNSDGYDRTPQDGEPFDPDDFPRFGK